VTTFYRALLALLAVVAISAGIPQRSDAGVFVGVGINVDIAPPPLPVYVQPPAPYPNAIWQPGYWGWGSYGYYWTPGAWVAAPRPGYLWTPGYWGFGGGYYAWHPGYWGPHVGFYGGVNYGGGYFGVGFVGGAWVGGMFRYNTAVMNVNTAYIHNTYVDRTVINNYDVNNRVSYNGGPGGVRAFPSAQEQSFAGERHFGMTGQQRTNTRFAQQNRNNLATVNGGHPQATFNRINAQDRATAARMNQHVMTNGHPGYHPHPSGPGRPH
jgi:hypothetical protein